MRRFRLALAALAIATSTGFAACSKSGGGGEHVLTGKYTLDANASVQHVEENERAWMTKAIAGVDATLEFYADNTYHLVVTGGPAPTDTTGTFKAGFDFMELTPTMVDGKPAPAGGTTRPKAPSRDWIVLKIGTAEAYLRHR